jgi:hypothetical protein
MLKALLSGHLKEWEKGSKSSSVRLGIIITKLGKVAVSEPWRLKSVSKKKEKRNPWHNSVQI